NSDPGTLQFAYTVQADDVDVDGIQVGALQLNGGAIGSGAAPANVFLNSIGNTTGVLVQGTPVPSIPSVSANALNPGFVENSAAVPLFSSVEASTNDSGQTFSELTLMVSSGEAGGSIDGEHEFLE